MEILLQELIEMIKSTAPEVWRIGMKQVEVSLAHSILGIVITLAVVIILFRFASTLVKNQGGLIKWFESDNSSAVAPLLLFALAMLFTVIVIVNVYEILQYLINPEYAAIEFLIDLAKGSN